MNATLDMVDSQQAKTKHTGDWKLGLLCAIVLAFITSLPQIYLCYVRGLEWNGSCAYLDTDELPYAAYTNALIDGRPRRNDPYTGKDGGAFETLFSIQFLPAYAMALPAIMLGVSANTVFIVLLPLATVASAFMIWWLLRELTANTPLALVGAIGVLSLGTAAAHSPVQILQGVVTGYDFFPFLRRSIPALPFPLFMALILFIWRALTRHWAWAVAAGLAFIVLVFSYFFLWTAAAAWFCTIGIFWFVARPQDRAHLARVFGIVLAMGAIALGPYVWLLAHRANLMNNIKLLELTHSPDLLRAPELYGGLLVGGLAYLVRSGKISWRDPRFLFTISFAIAPFLVFNQQILTGRSLQPFHYEEFITNYWVVLACFLSLGILGRKISKRIIVYLALGAVGTAGLLGVLAAQRSKGSNVRFDEVRAVALKLRQENLGGLVFASDFRLTNSIATTASNPVLWARHMYTFSNVDSVEQKKRYYQHLYYSGFEESQLVQALNTDFFARWEVFGAERANPVLTAGHIPITDQEIRGAGRDYAAFASSYSRELARNPLLSYAVVASGANLSNLDRWYERSEIQRTGDSVIYRLTLRLPE